MGNDETVQYVKQIIVHDLFEDVDNKKCVLDTFIEQSSKLNIDNLKIHKVSQYFLHKSMNELSKEYDKGQILFFRKYAYEKILNKYLGDKFHIEVESDWLSSEKRKSEQYEEKSSENNVSKLEKTNKKSINEKDKIQKKKKTATVEIKRPESKKVQNKKTVSKVKKKNCEKSSVPQNNSSYLRLEYESSLKKAMEKIAKNYKLDETTVHIIILTVQKRCPYYRRNECTKLKGFCFPFYKDCMFYNTFNTKLIEKSKEINCYKRKIDTTKKEVAKHNGNNNINIQQIGIKDFAVRANVFRCMHSKHVIENIDAMIKVASDSGKNEIIEISAGYCSQCKVYFLMESTYQKLKKKGIILCRISDEKNYRKMSQMNDMHLAQESILMQYGYNASQTEGLSATGRQKILAVIIDNKIMSKSEVISYLDFFINQRSSIPRMELAISKWEADRDFVENYKIGQYTQFGVKAIYRR